ncbi:MAG TPA: class I SAM-dependent methyltransferase, partial [Actinoplanes sp.]|nr:class I SAM-dependent methyltransferase [Actinoplanes sp.]
YGRMARFYDVLSLEWPVYRVGRELGIEALGLGPGDRVLDLGCGTGLSLPLVRAAVGAGGAVVGVDASAVMVRQARARVTRAGWRNVDVLRGDAAFPLPAGQPFDAVLCTYALSVIGDWRQAWARAWAVLRPGGRVTVVDLALPSGRWRVMSPAARLACFAGGSDPRRHPWTMVLDQAVEVSHLTRWGGHVHVVSGTRPV